MVSFLLLDRCLDSDGHSGCHGNRDIVLSCDLYCRFSLKATNGLKAAGYEYVNIDDCWQVSRFPNKTIQSDPNKFPI